MYGYNAGQPMAIPIYTVLPYCVIPVFMQNFRLKVYKVYLFWHRYSLHYNVLSGPIIISLSRSKGVNGKIICLCTSLDETCSHAKNFRSKAATDIELRFFMKKKQKQKQMKMKNLWKSCLPVFHTSCDIFIPFFACSYFFTYSPPWCH